jgi:hypothetical protein
MSSRCASPAVRCHQGIANRGRVHAGGMSFFESISQPSSPEPARWHRPAWMRSDSVIPGPVPVRAVLIRTDDVAVAVSSVRAYLNGFEFTLHTRLRREDDARPSLADPLEWHGHGRQHPDDVLRLGIMYADGRRAAATGGHPWPLEDGTSAERLVLLQDGGGGSDRRWDGDFWVHPLPSDGPVTFVTSWLKYGVAESRADIDGTAIREAARHAVILWPDEPEFEPGAAWTSQTLTLSGPDDSDASASSG